MASGVSKGIILAGGSGTRMHPATLAVCKQLLPIYDKPLVYYPLTTLIQCGITEILLISTPEDTPRFRELFGDGSQLGLRFEYCVQPRPEGIAQAFILGADFIGSDSVALILGDNIFYGDHDFVSEARDFGEGGLIFAYQVQNPQRYGVVEFDGGGRPLTIIEKPTVPKSSYAVTGLYFYDAGVVAMARELKPSRRGELEIADINQAYLDEKKLRVVRLDKGFTWLDTGTHESMLEASNFIATIEKRRGCKIACVEEAVFRKGLIDRRQLRRLIKPMTNNAYRRYLEGVAEESDG